MADQKITQLTSYTTPIATDVLPIVDITSNITKKIAYSALSAEIQVTNLPTYVAAEAGNAGDFLCMMSITDFARAGTPVAFGKVTTNKKYGVKMIGSGVSMTTMKLALRTQGSPIDNILVRVETDSAGTPSGTLANANATSTVAGSGAAFADTTVTFAGAFTLSLGTTYWVVLYRDGAESDANYYEVGKDPSFNTFTTCEVNGGAWGAPGNVNVYFNGTGFLMNGVFKNQLTMTTSLFLIVGCAAANYTAGGNVQVYTEGMTTPSLFSNLKPGWFYNAAANGGINSGNIAVTSVFIAVAVSTTQLKINIYPV